MKTIFALWALATPMAFGQEPTSPLQANGTAQARPSGIAARVNGEIITWDEVELKLQGTADERNLVRKPQLRKMAEDKLFLQEAKKLNLTITDAQVDMYMKEFKKQFKTEEAFMDHLKRIEAVSLTEFREEKRSMLLVNALIQRLMFESFRNPGPNSKLLLEFVSPNEVQDYFKSHPEEFKEICEVDLIRLSVQFAAADRPAKMALMESLQRKVEEGTDLFVLAIYYMNPSEMPVLPNGTRIPGYKSLKKESQPFEPDTNDLIFNKLDVGKVSAIIEDKNTLNLFQVKNKIDQKQETFETAQPNIRRKLEHEKRTSNRRLLRDELIKRSFIEPADLFK